MDDKKLSINEFITKFDNGEFNSKNLDIQIDAGWFDWFCKDTSLCNKTKILAGKLKSIIKHDKQKKIDIHNDYVFFKNNCPLYGQLYDHISICDIKERLVKYCIIPKNGHMNSNGIAELWGKENKMKKPLASGKWQDIINFFKNG